jgi:hypothetical protein
MKPRHIAALTAFVGISMALGLVFPRFRRAEQTSTCQSNLKEVRARFVDLYRDYDEKMPPSARWNDVLRPYRSVRGLKSMLNSVVCSTVRSETGYAMNRFVADGPSLAQITPAATTPLLFDSILQKPNASDFGASFPIVGVHFIRFDKFRGNNVLFADGTSNL